jgi:hypothetical protein
MYKGVKKRKMEKLQDVKLAQNLSMSKTNRMW